MAYNNRRMIFKRYLFIILFFAAIFFSACKLKILPEYIEEGIIEYEITYFESEDENPIIGLLPNKMEIKFKENKSLLNVVGWLGIFSSVYISDTYEGYNYTMMKIMDKKYSYKGLITENIPGYKNPENYEVEFLVMRKIIKGYPCKKALITMPGHDFNPLTIHYYDQIKLSNHLLSNIYSNKIPGFLFEFPIEINGISMQLKVKKITPCEIPDSDFYIPEDYQRVSKEKMQEIIESII